MRSRKAPSRAAAALLTAAVAAALALSHPGRTATAAAGDLDPSFDADGKVITSFGAESAAASVAIQPDGRVVVAGFAGQDFAVARYNADGSPDEDFGAGGKVTTAFDGVSARASGVAIQPDGKIVVAGTAGEDFAVARYNADGSLDTLFDADGKTTTDFFAGLDEGRAVVVGPTGRIIVAGRASSPSGRFDFGLAAYRTNGTLDSFGLDGSGKVTTTFDAPSAAFDVAIQPDGKIVAVGEAAADFAAARYEVGGLLDRTFNTGGRQAFGFTHGYAPGGTGEVSFNRFDRATAVALRPDGRILVGGSVQVSNNVFAPGFARLLPDGRLDSSFSGNGLALFRGPGLDSFFVQQAVAIALQTDGKLVAATRGFDFHVVRLSADGALDTAFGGDGIASADFNPDTSDAAAAVLIQPDGRVVAAGATSEQSPGSAFAVARFLNDAPTIVQCLYGLSRPNHHVPVEGGEGSFHVFAPASCPWTAVSSVPWITLTPGVGSGSGPVSFTVEPTGAGPRAGTITVAGQTFTVTQGGFKVAVYYSGGFHLVESVRGPLAASGRFAQVDGFVIGLTTTPTLAHLFQYDAVFYFHNQVSGPPHPNQDIFGDVLADYVFGQNRGVVIAGHNWDDAAASDPVGGNLRLFNWLPFTPGGQDTDFLPLIKLRPEHPVFENISSTVTTGLSFAVGLTQGAERLADWGDGRPAVAVKRPAGGRVVGLNIALPLEVRGDLQRLLANSLHWAASGNVELSFVSVGAATVTVSEGAGGADIPVVRTGDLSGTTSVVFSTVDDSSAVRCDTVDGKAYPRCDYETTVVTLTFAPGETQKIVRVPIIDDGHADGQETVRLGLDRTFGAQGNPTGATLVIDDNDGPNAPNPFFDHTFFVRQHYLDFLSREPEPAGLAAWVGVLNGCPNVDNDPECDRATVSSGFFRSNEFSRKGYYVFRFYRAAFGRLPTYAEMIADMQAVGGATEAELAGSRAAFAAAFSERAEFLLRHAPSGTTPQAYVESLMDIYDLQSIRTPDPANPEGGTEVTLTREDLRARLASHELTRAQVLRAIVESREVDAAEFNRAFVAMQYYGYLRRTPEEPGFTNWLNHLNANPTDFRTMIKGFIDSVEYRLRFGRP